ncbi:MAG: hypothetical protein O2976_04380 [Actinomycetota bacterium]|nr:hypothetical protein [Actinomycetota bacterium]
MNFAMFDQVRLLTAIPASSTGPDDPWPAPPIPAGTEGVVMELEGTPSPIVEWFDAFGNTIDCNSAGGGRLEIGCEIPIRG